MGKKELAELYRTSGGLDDASIITLGEPEHIRHIARTLQILGMSSDKAYCSASTSVKKREPYQQ